MPTPRDETAQKAKTAKQAGKPEDAIQLLMTDHREVEALFKKFEKAKDGHDAGKADIVAQICDALSVHAEIEEEIFYPAARDALSEKDGEFVFDLKLYHSDKRFNQTLPVDLIGAEILSIGSKEQNFGISYKTKEGQIKHIEIYADEAGMSLL